MMREAGLQYLLSIYTEKFVFPLRTFASLAVKKGFAGVASGDNYIKVSCVVADR